MDFSPDESKPHTNRPGLILAIFHKVLGITGRLIGFFTLTEEDRLMAGIYTGAEGRDG